MSDHLPALTDRALGKRIEREGSAFTSLLEQVRAERRASRM
jgi:hypothetical protein